MKVRTAQKLLIGEWFILGGFVLVVLVGQWLGGHYGDRWLEAFNWFGATIAPTLTLMLGGLGVKAAGRSATNGLIDGLSFTLAFGSCLIYLLVCVAVILLAPFAQDTPLELLKESEKWLHLVQGVSGVALGWFFMSNQKKDVENAAA